MGWPPSKSASAACLRDFHLADRVRRGLVGIDAGQNRWQVAVQGNHGRRHHQFDHPIGYVAVFGHAGRGLITEFTVPQVRTTVTEIRPEKFGLVT